MTRYPDLVAKYASYYKTLHPKPGTSRAFVDTILEKAVSNGAFCVAHGDIHANVEVSAHYGPSTPGDCKTQQCSRAIWILDGSWCRPMARKGGPDGGQSDRPYVSLLYGIGYHMSFLCREGTRCDSLISLDPRDRESTMRTHMFPRSCHIQIQLGG